MRRRAGFTLIELMIVIAIIAIIAAIAIPSLIEARKASNEAASIGSLKAIFSAQVIFHDRDKDMNGVYDYAITMAALGTARLIDGTLASGTKQGYTFTISSPDPEDRFIAQAAPVSPGKSGDRYFRIDESGVIRYGTLIQPSAQAPAIGE